MRHLSRLALVCYIRNNTHLACYYGNKGEVENIGYLYLTNPHMEANVLLLTKIFPGGHHLAKVISLDLGPI